MTPVEPFVEPQAQSWEEFAQDLDSGTHFDLPPDAPEVIAEATRRGLFEVYDADAWAKNPGSQVETRLKRVRSTPVEVWMRDPTQYLEFVAQRPYHLFTVTGFSTNRKKWEPWERVAQVLPAGAKFRVMVVYARSARIYDIDTGNPVAQVDVPAWRFGHDPMSLIRLCNNFAKRGWERLVISGVPKAGRHGHTVALQQQVHEWLFRVMAAYPEIPFHLFGAQTYRHMFGSNYASVDHNPNMGTRLNQVTLPNGKSIRIGSGRRHLKWLHVVGFSATDLATHWTNRTAFTWESALWAAKRWNDPEALEDTRSRKRTDPLGLLPVVEHRTTRPAPKRQTLSSRLYHATLDNPDSFGQFGPDPTEPYAYAEPVTNAPWVAVSPREKDMGDKIVCNACSLAPTCRVYREGSVCVVSSSPAKSLVEMFGTRDALTVRNALGEVLAQQADRYMRSAQQWREDGTDVEDLRKSEHLMKMENSLTRSGEALVKLLDPSFRDPLGPPAIQNNTLNVYNPRVLVADVVKQLEAAGVQRADIDPSMIVEVAKERGMIE